MEWLANRALQITTVAVAFFWTMVIILGADLTRDVVDVGVAIVCTVMLFRILPHAGDRFFRGGGEKRWQVIMSLALFLLALDAQALWGFAARYYDRPQWMIESPVNGFLRYWLFGAGLLLFSATSQLPEVKPRPGLYYLAIGLLGGIFIGAAAFKVALEAKLIYGV